MGMRNFRRRFRRLSLQTKVSLVAGAATTLASLVAVAGLMLFELSRAPGDLVSELGSVVRATAHQSRAALVFANPTDAAEQLSYLSEFKEIRRAWIIEPGGTVFARFARDEPIHPPPEGIDTDGSVFFEDSVVLRQSITTGSVLEGYLYVEANLTRVDAIRRRLMVLGIFAALLGIVTSTVIVQPLRRWLTRPILTLAAVAQRVKRDRTYDIRAISTGRDEVGDLVEAFNDMLDAVQERERSLVLARARAEQLADQRSLQANELELANAQLVSEINERRKLQEQLLQAQKMESIGQLAGGIAHDFNNLLTVILGWTEYAGGSDRDSERMSEGLEQIHQSAERAATLTRQLLAFARRQVIRPEVLSVNELIEGLQRLLTAVLGEAVELKLELAEGVPNVFVDPGQFEQIFLNLALNARDAMPAGGHLTLKTRFEAIPEDIAAEFPEVEDGHAVRITATDDGPGVPVELQSKIFEPFFTTKEKGKGTGLGLAMCYGIVRQSDGVLRVESDGHQGTSFHIYLPAHFEQVEDDSGMEESLSELGGKETILIVEDQPEVRALMERTFRSGGYEVLMAIDGQDGIALGRAHLDALDLLITDLKMPGADGHEVLRRLREGVPNLPAILISGHANEISESLPLPEHVHFVQKPFTPSALLREVREILKDVGR